LKTTIVSLILGVVFFTLSQANFYSKTYLSITTDDWVSEYKLALTDNKQNTQFFSQKPPSDYPFFYIFDENYVDTYQPLLGHFTAYFPLSSETLFQTAKLSLISSFPLAIKNICLHNTFKEKCWTTKELSTVFDIQVSTQETFLQYKDNFQVLQQQFLISHISQKILIFILVIIFINLSYYFYLQREKIHFFTTPQAIFLWFGGIFGVLTCFINPLFQVPDEIYHLSHAFYLTQNDKNQHPINAIISAAELHLHYRHTPILFQEKRAYFSQLPLHLQSTLQTHYTKHYFMFPYIPSSIGIYIGKTFELSWLDIIYVARLANLFVWLMCTYLAIRLIPIGKWLFSLIVLSPMSLFQAASISIDSLANGLSFLLVALILKFAMEKEKQRFLFLGIIVTSIFLALTKAPYFILIGLLFLIFTQQPAKFNRYLPIALGLVLIILFVLGSILFLGKDSSGFLKIAFEQILGIFQHPIAYFEIVFETIRREGLSLINGWVGIFGWLEIPLPKWFVIVHIGMLFTYAIATSNEERQLNNSSKFIIFSLLILGILTILTTLYIIETPLLKLPYIDGLQGRYFVPLGILAFLLFQNRIFSLSNKTHLILSTLHISFSLIFMLFSIHQYYH